MHLFSETSLFPPYLSPFKRLCMYRLKWKRVILLSGWCSNTCNAICIVVVRSTCGFSSVDRYHRTLSRNFPLRLSSDCPSSRPPDDRQFSENLTSSSATFRPLWEYITRSVMLNNLACSGLKCSELHAETSSLVAFYRVESLPPPSRTSSGFSSNSILQIQRDASSKITHEFNTVTSLVFIDPENRSVLRRTEKTDLIKYVHQKIHTRFFFLTPDKSSVIPPLVCNQNVTIRFLHQICLQRTILE